MSTKKRKIVSITAGRKKKILDEEIRNIKESNQMNKDSLYFVNEQHQQNYTKMKEKFPRALNNTEYQAACYISSAPLIFEKFENQLSDFDSPID